VRRGKRARGKEREREWGKKRQREREKQREREREKERKTPVMLTNVSDPRTHLAPAYESKDSRFHSHSAQLV